MSKTPLRSLKAIAVVAGLVFAQGAVLTQQSSPVHANASTAFITVQQAPGVGGAQQLSVTGSGFTPNVPINVVFNAPQGYGLASHAPEPFPAGGTESVPVSVANEGAVPGDTTPESIPVAAPGVGGTSATQTLSETGAPTGGSFTLTFNGSITGSIAFNAAAGPTTTLGTVANMLNALPSVTAAGGVTVIGEPLPGTPDTITFGNAGTQNLITTNSSGLRGGSGTVAPGTPSGSPTTPASDTVSEAGPPTGGGFTLSFNGNTTALIPFSATAAQVAADLNALASVVTAGGVGA
ncbi:MAG TPA: hypothetical protein VNL71_11945, partial [Chloroflexota bacterium]|nr:hypothetical protein [Chloroflexota bacterium]